MERKKSEQKPTPVKNQTSKIKSQAPKSTSQTSKKISSVNHKIKDASEKEQKKIFKQKPQEHKQGYESLPIRQIKLVQLQEYLQEEQTKCLFLVDPSGNAHTFFKYKAKLIDLPDQILRVKMQQKKKEEVIQFVRISILWAFYRGETLVFHFGSSVQEGLEMLNGQTFWNIRELMKNAKQVSEQWYRTNVMRPDDKDNFGNLGMFFVKGSHRVILSFTSKVSFEEVSELLGLQKDHFIGLSVIP